MATFKARFKETGNFKAKFGQVTVIHTYDYEWYEGPYEVTPRVYAQVLETEMKLMREDVDVEGIPYNETGNTYGVTCLIGEGGGGQYDLQSKSVTPTDEEQVVKPDAGYYGLSSVRVSAMEIPSYYGRIDWNGSYLTVS